MITHPNCKVNLGLHVLSRRPDGYHNIESIFVPVMDICDELEINIVDLPGEPHALFETDDPMLQTNDNLCLRAYNVMRRHFPSQVGSVAIKLSKHIPYGAGIGGGSADAAFVIKMIAKLFAIDVADYELARLSTQVGADCPFFIFNQAAYVTGIGDVVMPVDFDLTSRGFSLELLKPQHVSVSTREAYAGVTPRNMQPSLYTPNLIDALQRPLEMWQSLFVNDFEQSISQRFGAINNLKQHFFNKGAFYASMSGSGSAVFALFKR